ncbi:hypothetical protein [Breoghania sp.]|uniref:hypothetical protein n=1 Tax=Breoghania sp. TaxID=2065378 RepID=UPI002AA7B18F|nr:hypothetical protein [Breoghania sp.]
MPQVSTIGTPRTKTGFVWGERFMRHMSGLAAGVVPAGGYVEPGLLHLNKPVDRQQQDQATIIDRAVMPAAQVSQPNDRKAAL